MTDGKITIELSAAEALVLFEFLSEYSDKDTLVIVDQAEQRVLWNMCADLEKLLSEPFRKSYAEELAAARAEVRDKE